MFDVVFISYDEPHADRNFARVQSIAPAAKRVHGVEGLRAAHVRAALTTDTEMLYVVDADCWVLDDFDFNFKPTVWDRKYTHIWHSINPVNQLQYGYGGIKCFNRKSLLNHTGPYVDFSTSVAEIKVIDTPSCITQFDSSPFVTFRSTVREIVKLYYQPQTELTAHRLDVWKTCRPTSLYWQSYLLAVEATNDFIKTNVEISKVTDYNWLHQLWRSM